MAVLTQTAESFPDRLLYLAVVRMHFGHFPARIEINACNMRCRTIVARIISTPEMLAAPPAFSTSMNKASSSKPGVKGNAGHGEQFVDSDAPMDAVLEKIASKQHQPWCQGEGHLGETVCLITNLEFGGVLVLTET